MKSIWHHLVVAYHRAPGFGFRRVLPLTKGELVGVESKALPSDFGLSSLLIAHGSRLMSAIAHSFFLMFLSLCSSALADTPPQLELIAIVGNSPRLDGKIPATLLIDQLESGVRLTIFDLKTRNHLLSPTDLTGHYEQREKLKADLKHTPSMGSHLADIPPALLKAVEGFSKDVQQRAVVLLVDGDTAADLTEAQETQLATALAKMTQERVKRYTIALTDRSSIPLLNTINPTAASSLSSTGRAFYVPTRAGMTEALFHVLNALQGYVTPVTSLVHQPEENTPFFLFDPRHKHVTFQFIFENFNATKIALEDTFGNVVYPSAQGDTYQLYRFDNPTLGWWQSIVHNYQATPVKQMVSVRQDPTVNPASLRFRRLERKYPWNAKIPLEVERISQPERTTPIYIDVISSMRVERLTLQPKKRSGVYAYDYKPAKIAGVYRFAILPDLQSVPDVPLQTVQIVAPSFAATLMGLVLPAVGLIAGGAALWYFAPSRRDRRKGLRDITAAPLRELVDPQDYDDADIESSLGIEELDIDGIEADLEADDEMSLDDSGETVVDLFSEMDSPAMYPTEETDVGRKTPDAEPRLDTQVRIPDTPAPVSDTPSETKTVPPTTDEEAVEELLDIIAEADVEPSGDAAEPVSDRPLEADTARPSIDEEILEDVLDIAAEADIGAVVEDGSAAIEDLFSAPPAGANTENAVVDDKDEFLKQLIEASSKTEDTDEPADKPFVEKAQKSEAKNELLDADLEAFFSLDDAEIEDLFDGLKESNQQGDEGAATDDNENFAIDELFKGTTDDTVDSDGEQDPTAGMEQSVTDKGADDADADLAALLNTIHPQKGNKPATTSKAQKPSEEPSPEAKHQDVLALLKQIELLKNTD